MVDGVEPEPDGGARSPAPGSLHTVQRFVNTKDVEAGTDVLDSPGALRKWLSSAGLMAEGETVTAAELRRAVAVREALRALLLSNNGEPLHPQAAAALDGAAAAAGLRVRFRDAGHAPLEPDSTGVDAPLGTPLGFVYEAIRDGTWHRLKACRSDTCRWAFYDHSRNRSGAWCSMAVCGNRSKVRAYHERRRGIAGADPELRRPDRSGRSAATPERLPERPLRPGRR